MSSKKEVYLMEAQGLRIDYDNGSFVDHALQPEEGFFRVISDDESPVMMIEVHMGGEVVTEIQVQMNRVLMIQYRRK